MWRNDDHGTTVKENNSGGWSSDDVMLWEDAKWRHD
jgi:hypothetical protein